MLPKVYKNLPRVLKIPDDIYDYLKKKRFYEKENSKINQGYWFISWLGRSYYIQGKIYREFYLTLCSNEYYNFSQVETFCIEFPEEYTIRYKQGNYYKYNGELIKSAYDAKEIRHLTNIIINRKKNTQIIDFDKFIGDSTYPLYVDQGIDPTYLDPYKNVPCYIIELDNQKYIIPLNVIQSYFYAVSSLTIYYLIYGILRESLLPCFLGEDHYVVPYRGVLMQEKEASFISKFYFLREGSFDVLNNIHDSFLLNITNSHKNNKPLRSYINYGLPFKTNVDLKMDLHFRPINEEKNVNLVYSIGNVKLVSEDSIFQTENFFLDNLDASLREEVPDFDKNPGNRKITNMLDENFETVSGSMTNNNDITANVFFEDNSPKFNETPDIENIIPERIRKGYGFQEHYINHIIKCDEDRKDQDSTSDTGLINYNVDGKDNSHYIDIVLGGFDLLKNDEIFECEYLYLRRQKNSNFSFDPRNSDENGSIVIFQIIYQLKTYCIIARNDESNRIGIIQKEGFGKFEKNHDESLLFGLLYVAKNHYNWTKLKKIKSKELNNRFKITHALNKMKGKTKEERVQNFYERVKKIIAPKEK